MNEHLSLSTAVILTPRRAGLRAGADQVVEVLLRVQAPPVPAGHGAERPPQALALVIDRSGSMAGRPLDEARRCAGRVIDRLRPTDSVALVQFDHRVQRLWPAVPLGDGGPLRAALAALHSGGNTRLHEGWKEGADTLSDVAGHGLKRVILLSDGQANEGLTDPDAIAAECAALAARGITTSTCGLGRHFNEALMVAMARAGGGNAYYGDTADDLMEPFERELALLDNLCLRDLRLQVSVSDGLAVELVNDLPATAGGWRLPDRAWGAEAWAVLRLTVPAAAVPAAGPRLAVLRVAVDGRTLQGEAVTLERTGLALPVLTPGAWAALPDDELVTRRLAELSASEELLRLRAAADRGDWAEVDRRLAEARQRFAGNGWVSAMLQSMVEIAGERSRERLLKESTYSSGKLRSRLASHDEDGDFTVAREAHSVPAYLRRKPSQGKGDL